MPSAYQLASEIWDKLDAPDYHVLAAELARRIAEVDDVEALVTPYAYRYSLHPRSWPRPWPGPDGNGEAADQIDYLTGGQPQAGAGQVNAARSSRVRLIRDTWPELRRMYAVSPTERRALLDMDAADLDYAVANLDGVARRTKDRANLLAQLRGELDTYQAGHVRDLPPGVLDRYAQRFR